MVWNDAVLNYPDDTNGVRGNYWSEVVLTEMFELNVDADDNILLCYVVDSGTDLGGAVRNRTPLWLYFSYFVNTTTQARTEILLLRPSR